MFPNYSAPGGPGSYYGNVYARDSESQPASAQDETYVSSGIASSPVAFRDQESEATYNAQQLAYKGYQHFQKGWSVAALLLPLVTLTPMDTFLIY
jgi:hypothetical protein